MSTKGNCIVGQSGGTTAAINASLCGVVQEAMQNKEIGKIYGAINGIEGVLKEKFIDLGVLADKVDFLPALKNTPASYLGSCRFKLPKIAENRAIFEEIFKIFFAYQIKYFFYIGGNDSMDTVAKISAYAKEIGYPISIIGVPKTIDNDLLGTDHTPGYGSAAKYIATTVREIGIDCDVYDLNSVTIVEIMGRNAGWLTAASALARAEGLLAPHLIYLPETPFNDEQFIKDIKTLQNRGIRNVVVAVSEGVRYADGTYVCENASSGMTDAFGHKCLSGTAKVLENRVRSLLGCKARGVEVNVIQRCAGHLTSLTDISESEQIGIQAVKEAIAGSTGKIMVFKRLCDKPYQVTIESKDIEGIANGEKIIPTEWIAKEGNDVTQAFVDYAMPLIMGETTPQFKDGVPVYLKRS
ncbi:MAG: 6-phosphofructokinase [Hyphomonadaceae bacterium]|nr:6-phosphofructokinase [Clostridia bacterium]